MSSNIIEHFFVAGPRGDAGQRGITGPSGPRGPQGIQGERGEKGERGMDSDNVEFIKKNTLWCADGQFCDLPEGKYINSSINIRQGNLTVRGLAGVGVDVPKEKLDVDGSINLKINEAYKSNRNWLIGQNEKKDIILGDENIENNMIFRSKRGAHVLFRTDGFTGFNNPNPNDVIDIIGNINISAKDSYKISGFNVLSVDVESQVVLLGNSDIPLNYAFQTQDKIPLIITSDGKIGVNTTLPQNALTVNANEPGFTNGLLINNSYGFGRDRGIAGSRLSFQRSDLIGGSLMNINMACIEAGNLDEANPKGGFLKFYVNPTNETGLDAAMSILPDTSVICESSITAEVYYSGDRGYLKKSSIRYKHDVCKISNALEIVDKLHGRTYKSNDTNKLNSGFIAEEVNQILPHLVGKDKNMKPDNIEYNSLIPYLVESIKELKNQNLQLLKEIYQLKRK
jgi:hypothetical protein